MSVGDAAKYKDEGNEHFKYGRWSAAADSYTEAIELDPTFHVAYSNRSAAYSKMGKGKENKALNDADKCIELAPEWPKGYTRKATALIALKKYEEAVDVCEKNLSLADSDSKDMALKQRKLSRTSILFKKISGKWNGPVSQELGGFVQEFDFTGEKSMNVSFMDKTFKANVVMDVEQEPMQLDLQIVHAEAPASMQAPAVPYIMKLIDENTLLISCPYMSQTRPSDFTGPGRCELKRGGQRREVDPKVLKLPRDERLLLCAQATLDKLPTTRVETPEQTDSEEVASRKLMSNIQFQNTVFELESTYGADALRDIFTAAHSPDTQPATPYGDLIRKVHTRMAVVGLLSDEVAGPQPKPPPPEPAKDSGPQRGAKFEEAVKEPTATSHDDDADDTSITIIVGAVMAVAVVIAGFSIWKHRRR